MLSQFAASAGAGGYARPDAAERAATGCAAPATTVVRKAEQAADG